MQRHFRPRTSSADADNIGATLPGVYIEPRDEKSTSILLDSAFVSALYNGLSEAILAVQFGTRRIVHWNKGAEAMFGYSAREVLGKTTEIIYPDQHSFERISQIAAPVIRKRGAWRSEWEYQRRDGSRFPADVAATMIEGAEGTEFYVIVIRDISERKQAEIALKEKSAILQKIQQRFRAVLDNTTMLVYVTGSDGKLGLINRRFETAFRVNAAGIGGTPLRSIFDRHTADALLENNAKVFAAAATMEFEEVIPQADGLHTYISVKVPLFDENGVLYAVCALATDITERKRDQEIIRKMNEDLEVRVMERTSEVEAVNEQLRQEILNRRQAEEKALESERLATIGVTTTKLVHEIANPLQVMATAVTVLDQYLHRQSDASFALCDSVLRDLKAEIERLMKFLGEFKDVARPKTLEIRPVKLPVLVGEVLMLEGAHYASLGIKVVEDFAADLPPIAGDPLRLKQVLLNLFKNAVEAMAGGGVLGLRAYREENRVVFEVSDTGAGIPAGINVFDLFTTSKPLGTGLGLPIVHDIVTAHRGTISYRNAADQGTIFRVTLPALRNFQ